jgi:monoamine oxidase
MPFPHAVLVGRLSQWVFSGGDHYYQVVISGSRELIGRPSDVVVDEVLADLRTAFPESHDAVLRTARVVTQPEAVFSPTPESEKLRPAQETNVPGLSLAGDWTASGWPATMESAVRSGYLAAEAALRALGRPDRCLIAEPPRAWLTRLLVR